MIFSIQNFIKLQPSFWRWRTAGNYSAQNSKAHFITRPTTNFIFKPIVLNINRRRQKQNIWRKFRAVEFATLQKFIFWIKIFLVFITFSKARIVNNFFKRRIAFRFIKFFKNFFPTQPRRRKRINPKTPHAFLQRVRIFHNVFLLGIFYFLLRKFITTIWTAKFYFLRNFNKISEVQVMKFATIRAFVRIKFLRAFKKCLLNATKIFNCRRWK